MKGRAKDSIILILILAIFVVKKVFEIGRTESFDAFSSIFIMILAFGIGVTLWSLWKEKGIREENPERRKWDNVELTFGILGAVMLLVDTIQSSTVYSVAGLIFFAAYFILGIVIKKKFA